MKIAAATTAPLPNPSAVSAKNLSTLLELIQALPNNKALVKTQTLGEITLSIKEPLQAKQLYHAVLTKEGEGFVAKELFTLPFALKKILSLKPLMSFEHFVSQLKEGKSPQKIVFELLSQNILNAEDKESLKEQMSQLMHLAEHQEAVIPLSYENKNSYLSFKKRIKKGEQYQLPFEAYIPALGILSGYISFFKHKKEAHIKVLSSQTKALLEAHAQTLPMELFVSVDRQITLKAQTTLLDIEV